MISTQTLTAHYSEYASQSDEWVNNMEKTKRSIVEYILRWANFQPSREPMKVVVLGASDKRYIPIHERVFGAATGKAIELKTFDVDTAHLGGESAVVVHHNVTQQFPGGPYDIIFSHELMKFLTPDEQLATIANTYAALAPGGVAMHIIHEPSIKGTPELRSWQFRVDPDGLVEKLGAQGISTSKVVIESESEVDWLRETTVIVLQK